MTLGKAPTSLRGPNVRSRRAEQVTRVRNLLRKPPRYMAARGLAELRAEAHRLRMRSAASKRGGLSRARIVPGGLAAALALTREAITALAPWEEAITALRQEPGGREEIARMAVLAQAREVELFGERRVRAGVPPRWNVDLHSGHGWPIQYHGRLDYRNLDRSSDVKSAWELSRLRHCVALAQAAAVLGDSDSLAALEADLWDWHERNPLGWSVNWACAMEVALRAVNLICVDGVLLARGEDYPARPLVVSSLYQHGWFLARHLEVSDVNGNHFLADAVGLVWLGRYFEGVGEATEWLERGSAMVLEAGDQQILEDGLDHEGSLPYHVLVLELFLLALVAGGRSLAGAESAVGTMIDAACAFVDDSGRVPDLGDDDGGRVTAFSDLPSRDARRVLGLGAAVLQHAGAATLAAGVPPHDSLWLAGPAAVEGARALDEHRRPSGPRHFPCGGLVVLGDARDHVAVSTGTVGFRGRGGHGHLDAMSFEAVLGSDVAVRDSGTGTYTGDPTLRNELRDARAHNVVVVDGLRYARLGGPGRLWRIDGDSPPQVLGLDGDSTVQRLRVVQTLPAWDGSAEVERSIEWSPGRLRWSDTVGAPPGAKVEHLVQVPDDCEQVAGGLLSARFSYRVDGPPEATLELEHVRRSERYGSVVPGRRAVLRHVSPGTRVEVSWSVTAR